MREIKTEINLEDYELFIEDPNDDSLSYQQLNQIISMHGFKKILKCRKTDLYEALSTIDLIKPQRSTLKDDFPPYDGFGLTLEQIKQDLQTLQWQECPVVSIQSLHPTVVDNPATFNDNDGVSTGSARSSFKISRKRRRSAKMRRVSAVYRRRVEQIISTPATAEEMNGGASSGVAREFDHEDLSLQLQSSPLFVDTYSWEF